MALNPSRVTFALGLALAGALASAPPARALDPLGQLSGSAPVGPDVDGIWRADLEAGSYVLRNDAHPSGLKRIFVPAAEGAGTREVAVDVAVEGEATAHGGLVYGVDDEAGVYHLFMLEPGPKATLYRVHKGQLAQPFSVPLEPGRESRRLMIRETERDAARFLVDGREVATVIGRGIGRGGVGIAAWGEGTFRFGAFWLSALPNAAGAAKEGESDAE